MYILLSKIYQIFIKIDTSESFFWIERFWTQKIKRFPLDSSIFDFEIKHNLLVVSTLAAGQECGKMTGLRDKKSEDRGGPLVVLCL